MNQMLKRRETVSKKACSGIMYTIVSGRQQTHTISLKAYTIEMSRLANNANPRQKLTKGLGDEDKKANRCSDQDSLRQNHQWSCCCIFS